MKKEIVMIFQADETEIYALEGAKKGDVAIMVEYGFVEEGLGCHNFVDSYAMAIKGYLIENSDDCLDENWESLEFTSNSDDRINQQIAFDFAYEVYPKNTLPKLIIGWPKEYISIYLDEILDNNGELIDWDKYGVLVDEICENWLY